MFNYIIRAVVRDSPSNVNQGTEHFQLHSFNNFLFSLDPILFLSSLFSRLPFLTCLVLASMAACKVAPDSGTYGLLMSVEPDNLEYVQAVVRYCSFYGSLSDRFSEAKNANIKLGLIFYLQYLRCAIKHGDDQIVVDILNEMQDNNVEPTAEIYQILFGMTIHPELFL